MTVAEWGQSLRGELGKLVKGQDEVIDQLLTGFLARGHVLLEGVPGLAKTLLAKAFAHALRADFRRSQFTPDLMPSDLTGVRVFHPGEGKFELQPGPVFTHFLLADEINRSPPKTQAALLQAMEERAVTIDGTDYALPDPFFVVATQNPVEHEGTYPLPEAQLDRFVMKVRVPYPAAEAELAMLQLHHAGQDPHRMEAVQPRAAVADATELAREIHAVAMEEKVMEYLLGLVRATRTAPQVVLGGSPRAAVALLACAKVTAALRGRGYCIPDDVKAMAAPVLRHRLILRPEAELEGLTADRYVESLLAEAPVPR